MYIQINHAKIDLNHAEEFVAACNSPQLLGAMPTARGYRGSYLLQSAVDPEEFVSVSLWDRPEDAQAFFSGPDYGSVMIGVRDFLLTGLDRRGYKAVIEYPLPEAMQAA